VQFAVCVSIDTLWWNDVLLTINSASRLLQAKINDLFVVADCFRLTAVKIEELRSEATFKPTRMRRQKHKADEVVRDQVPVSEEDHYRSSVYFRVRDSMAGEIKSRSEGLQDVYKLFRFLYTVHFSKISHMDAVQCVGKLHKRFHDYFISELAVEIISLQMLYFAVNTSTTAVPSNTSC